MDNKRYKKSRCEEANDINKVCITCNLALVLPVTQDKLNVPEYVTLVDKIFAIFFSFEGSPLCVSFEPGRASSSGERMIYVG